MTYAPTLVPIKHIHYSGVVLIFTDYSQPPLADGYPIVVATANGAPVTGVRLAGEQVHLELTRRNMLNSLPRLGVPQATIDRQVAAIGSIDSLEAVIDRELERQVAERLGFMPSLEQALTLTRQAEDQSNAALAAASPEARPQLEQMLTAQGLLNTDWAAKPQLVELFRIQRGLTVLHQKKCKPASVQNAAMADGYDCSGLMTKERKQADIVYYVRWAD